MRQKNSENQKRKGRIRVRNKKNKGKNKDRNRGTDNKESENKPRINLGLGSDETNDEEHDSDINKDDLNKNGDTNPRITLHEEDEADPPNEGHGVLSFGGEKLDFERAHEIRTEKETTSAIKQRKEECMKVKNTLEYDQNEENLDVVKSDEGQFYSLK